MRFISHIRNFAVGVVEHREHATAYGTSIVDRQGYIAQFKQDVTEADVEAAQRIFELQGNVHGRTLELDEMTPTPLINRISVFDTAEEAAREGWDGKTVTDDRGVVHDFRTYVERFLSERVVGHQDFALIEEPKVEAPWPRYLEFDGTFEQLMQKIVADGYDLGHVLQFEQQEGRRPQVIEGIEALMLAQDADVTQEIHA